MVTEQDTVDQYLFDETNEKWDRGVLHCDGARHPAVRPRQVEQQVDRKLSHHLVEKSKR